MGTKNCNSDNIAKVIENQGEYGRLRYITKCKKLFCCRECLKDIVIGEACFCQSDYTQDAFFPEQTRLCLTCGQVQIDKGVKIKNQELFDKHKEKKIC